MESGGGADPRLWELLLQRACGKAGYRVDVEALRCAIRCVRGLDGVKTAWKGGSSA
jgi:hypothetical protein